MLARWLVVFSLILFALPAYSDTPEGSEPSTLVQVLRYDPIPGDALFATGHPWLGSANMVTGGLGLYGVIYSGIELGRGETIDGPQHMAGGLALYFPMLVWDATGAIDSKADKSIVTAWVLGLDPFPGDALFYANKPIQGYICTLLGALGATMLGYGIPLTIESKGSNDPLGFGEIGGVTSIVMGSLFYLPAFLWDAVNGISGVYSYNEGAKHSANQPKWLPIVAMKGNSWLLGTTMAF